MYISYSIKFLHFDFPAAASSFLVDSLLDPSHVVLNPGIDCHWISPGATLASVHLMRARSDDWMISYNKYIMVGQESWLRTCPHSKVLLDKILKTDQANQHRSAIRLHGVKGTSWVPLTRITASPNHLSKWFWSNVEYIFSEKIWAKKCFQHRRCT